MTESTIFKEASSKVCEI